MLARSVADEQGRQENTTSISLATLAQLADVSTQCGWISVPLHTNPPSASYRVGMAFVSASFTHAMDGPTPMHMAIHHPTLSLPTQTNKTLTSVEHACDKGKILGNFSHTVIVAGHVV